MITVVLDEACAQLEAETAAFAPVLVFRRKAGFRCRSSIAARELHQMLVASSIMGRAVYVAPSFAGFTAMLVADGYKNALSGVLLLDPSHPRQSSEALRILEGAPPSSERERLRVFLAGFGPDWEGSCREVAWVTTVGSLPLVILAGGRFDLSQELPEAIKAELLRSRHLMLAEYSSLSARGLFEVVESAGHDIARQTPEAVLSATKRLLACIEAEPNQALEPTTPSVMTPAEQEVTPARVVAHL